MSDDLKRERPREGGSEIDSQIENGESAKTALSEITSPQSVEPGGLMVFYVTSSQTRLPSRYRRRRRRASTRLAHMRRRELRYTGPNFGDMGR